MTKKYKVVCRPPEVAHGCPFLVYDCAGDLHLDLTKFSKKLISQVNKETAKAYLSAILRYFTWLDTDKRQIESGRCWKEPPEQVQCAVEDYLLQQMSCKIQQHKKGFQLIRPTDKQTSQVRMFLVALKCFYKIMKRLKYYDHKNPLVDVEGRDSNVDKDFDDTNEPPRMPDISGVYEPPKRQRLTDSYYKFIEDKWLPQIIDDPTLPRMILEGGHKLSGWTSREECVTRMLFETGARISEIVGLTLADWVERGMLQEAKTFSKGSNGIRVKVIRFSKETAKLIQHYFNENRKKYDLNNHTLDNYLQLSKSHKIDLQTVPLFLTSRKTPLTPKNYRDNYWTPACNVAEIKMNLHQARHWYVTQAIRTIHEKSTTEGDLKKYRKELQMYMGWKSEETIEAYEHYFDVERHAEIQNCVHAQMDKELKQQLEEWQQRQPQQQIVTFTKLGRTVPADLPEDDEFKYLRAIGGRSSAD
jgi:integrase